MTALSRPGRNCKLQTHPLVREDEITWPQSASELYRPCDRRLSVNLVPTFADRGCHVVSVMDPYDRILGFLDRP
jgi:CBS-domain-containing membrane protein